MHITETDLPKTDEEKKTLDKFPFRSFIGKLWWLALVSRPDIVHAVHRCACEQNAPSEKLKRWVLRIVKYLKHTKDLGLVFQRKNFSPEHILVGYADVAFMSEPRSMSRHAL